MKTLVRFYVRSLVSAALLLLMVVSGRTWLIAQHRPAAGRSTDGTVVVSRDLARVRLKAGPVVEALNVGPVQPLSLAAADFDEDGIPDLVAGLVAGDLPLLALYRGNAASIYGEETGTSPFFAPIRVELPLVPDFLGTGDFDADGHLDLAAGARGAASIAWLRGDGSGAFGPAHLIGLPAAATGMVAGELNRDDGLADLAVTVSGEHGSYVLLFAGPSGRAASSSSRASARRCSPQWCADSAACASSSVRSSESSPLSSRARVQ